MHAQQIISTHPRVRGSTNDALVRCIEECYDCSQVCTACADACLGEDKVKDLTQCIRLCLDCADVCAATGSLASRRTGANEILLKTMLDACAQACQLCGEECTKHASMHQHCKVCAEACKRCEQACRTASSTVTPTRRQ
jgi:Domain of Unknown Function (DUF326)